MTTQEKNGWRPIESAPKDNKRALYLARFDSDGKLVELDFDGSWDYWQESWELSGINGYCWTSNSGIEDPTHWAYQDEPLPAVGDAPKPAPAVQDAVREAFQNVYDEGFGDAHKDPDNGNTYRAKTAVHAATVALLAKLAPGAEAVYEIRVPDSDTLNVWHEVSLEAYSYTRAEDRRIVYTAPQADASVAGAARSTIFDLDAAAKALAGYTSRSWENASVLERVQLRRDVQSIICAAVGQQPQWKEL